MKAVKAKMFSLMPSSMKNYGESAVTLRDEVELRMKMNSVSKMIVMVTLIVVLTIIIFNEQHIDQMSWYDQWSSSFTIIIINDHHDDQMSWYDRAKGRRKFRVNEEDEGLIQVLHITLFDYDDDGDDGVDDDDDDDDGDDDDDIYI